MDRKLVGKVAVITGGNSGIGLKTARLFKAEGASLVIVGQDAETLERAHFELGAVVVQANVARFADMKRVMQTAHKAFGRIDVFFANAGLSQCPSLKGSDEAALDHIIATNFRGVFFTFTQALPYLSENASMIFTSSAAHNTGRLGDPLYAETKAAVRSLVRTFADNETVLAKNIRVNALTSQDIAKAVLFLASEDSSHMTGAEIAVDGGLAQV